MVQRGIRAHVGQSRAPWWNNDSMEEKLRSLKKQSQNDTRETLVGGFNLSKKILVTLDLIIPNISQYNIDIWKKKTRSKPPSRISLVYYFGHPASLDVGTFLEYTTSCCSSFLFVSKPLSLLHKSSKRKHTKTTLFFQTHPTPIQVDMWPYSSRTVLSFIAID